MSCAHQRPFSAYHEGYISAPPFKRKLLRTYNCVLTRSREKQKDRRYNSSDRTRRLNLGLINFVKEKERTLAISY